MTVDVYWTLPVGGWGPPAPIADRGLTDLRPGRFTDLDRTVQVARAAEATGFAGVLVPYDPAGDDAFVTATALAREVPRLRIMVEIQPGFATAVYTAKLALSFQRFFDDRLVWKLALDTPAAAQRTVGDRAEGADRIARAAELLDVSAGVWRGAPFSHAGDWFDVTPAGSSVGRSRWARGTASPVGRRRRSSWTAPATPRSSCRRRRPTCTCSTCTSPPSWPG